MKIINGIEVEQKVGQYGYKKLEQNPIVVEIKKLSVGQALCIPREEWKYKSDPSVYFANIKRRIGFVIKIRNLPKEILVIRIA